MMTFVNFIAIEKNEHHLLQGSLETVAKAIGVLFKNADVSVLCKIQGKG